MKLRKSEIKSPKSFSIPHWKVKDLHGGIHGSLGRLVHFHNRQPAISRQGGDV